MSSNLSPTTPLSHPSPLFDRAVILSVTLRRPGTRRKASTSLIEVVAPTPEQPPVTSEPQSPTSPPLDDTSAPQNSQPTSPTDKSLLHLTKDILDSEELRAIQRLDGLVRDYLSRLGLPSPLKNGCYLIPIDLIETVEAKLGDLFAQRDTLVQTFLTAYPEKCAQAASRLGPLFDPRDYPSIETLQEGFEVSTQYLTFGVPGTLQSISKSLLEREEEKAKQRIAAIEDEIVQVLRLSLKELVDHMVDRLQPGADGKPKVFRNTLMTNMQEFLETFKARNLTNDQDLEALVDQAKGILAGVDATTLRTNDATRSHVQAQLTQIKHSLDGLVVAKPTRYYAFNEETTPTPAPAV